MPPNLPDKPEYANRLGIFGYERETAVADVTDGLDKTIFMIQALPNIARPWIRGGGATVQGVNTTESFAPFRLMQSDGDFGAFAIMCDGSVRFVKTSIPDDSVPGHGHLQGQGRHDGHRRTCAEGRDHQSICGRQR